MLACNWYIEIESSKGLLQLDFINEIEVRKSYKELTNTAKVVMPRRCRLSGKDVNIVDTGFVNEGNMVRIFIGYDGYLYNYFNGYVTKRGADYPFTFHVEDESYLLKKNEIAPKQFQNANLKDVLEYVLPSWVKYKADDINLGTVLINEKMTSYKAIEGIKKEYPALYFFFRDDVLHAGRPSLYENRKSYDFDFAKNMFNYGRLQYVKAEDMKIKVNAVSIQNDNTKLEVTVGDKDGALRTFYTNNMSSKAELEKWAKTQLEEVKYDGLFGSFDTFGLPVVNPFDIIKLTDSLENRAERQGNYVAEEITLKSGVKHAHVQTIALGKKWIASKKV